MTAELKRPVLIGFVASAVITFVSSMRGWPFPSLTGEPWILQQSSNAIPTRYGALLVFFAAVGVFCWAWYRLLQLAQSGVVTKKHVWLTFALWVTPLMVATPLFSGDVYVYYVDGQAIARGFDPYQTGVSAMGPTELVHMVHPIWRSTTTMYGPVFMRLAEGVALLVPNSVIAGVMIFRLLSLVSVIAMTIALGKLAEWYKRPVAEGMVFALLNPLTMLHLIGGAHNDAIMLGLLCVGLAIGVRSQNWLLRFLAALSLCAAAGAFKIPGFAGALVLGWIWAGGGASYVRRCCWAAGAGVLALISFELQTLLTGLGWGWLRSTDVPGQAHPLLAPVNAVALSFGDLFKQGYALNSVTRGLGTITALSIAIWLVFRTGRNGTTDAVIRATGWALLTIAWLGPAVYPWYLAWGIAIVGALGPGHMRKHLIAATIAVSFVVSPGGYGMLDLVGGTWHTAIAFVVVAVFFWAIRSVLRTNQIDLPEIIRNVVGKRRRPAPMSLSSADERAA